MLGSKAAVNSAKNIKRISNLWLVLQCHIPHLAPCILHMIIAKETLTMP